MKTSELKSMIRSIIREEANKKSKNKINEAMDDKSVISKLDSLAKQFGLKKVSNGLEPSTKAATTLAVWMWTACDCADASISLYRETATGELYVNYGVDGNSGNDPAKQWMSTTNWKKVFGFILS